MNFLKGKKTYLVAALMVVLSGLESQGFISKEQSVQLMTLLTGLGFAALRHGTK